MRDTYKNALMVTGVALLTVLAAELGLRAVEDSLLPPLTWPTLGMHIKDDQLAGLESADVVFLGTSITEAGIDPDLFIADSGVETAYNSGLPFVTVELMEVWIDEVLLTSVTPQTVILGIPAWAFSVADDVHLGLFERVERRVSEPEPSRLALVRNRGLFSDWEQRVLLERARKWLTPLGHQTFYHDLSAADSPTEDQVRVNPPMTDEAEAVLQRIISGLGDRGIEVAVVIEPGRHPFGGWSMEYRAYLDSVMERSEDWGVPVWNTFDRDWDRSLFADNAHFNLDGTVLYTRLLSDLYREHFADG